MEVVRRNLCSEEKCLYKIVGAEPRYVNDANIAKTRFETVTAEKNSYHWLDILLCKTNVHFPNFSRLYLTCVVLIHCKRHDDLHYGKADSRNNGNLKRGKLQVFDFSSNSCWKKVLFALTLPSTFDLPIEILKTDMKLNCFQHTHLLNSKYVFILLLQLL